MTVAVAITTPCAKTAFSNDRLGHVIGGLIAKGHKVEFDPASNTLSIYGDLKTDIEGLACNLVVCDGDIYSNVSISHNIEVKNSKVTDLSHREIKLNGTVIRADRVLLRGSDMTAINGHGEIFVNRTVSANHIEGNHGELKIKAGSIYGENCIRGAVECTTSGVVRCKHIEGYGVRIFAGSADIGEITKGAQIIAGRTEFYKISNGAKVFSAGELKCQNFGGLDQNQAPIMVVINEGFEERQFRRGAIHAHNAVMFSPHKEIFDDVEIIRVGFNPHDTILTDNFDGLPEEMIDLIRLGYSTMQKQDDIEMPKHVADEIHRRYAPSLA